MGRILAGAFRWGLIVGGIGFAAGFFGPMILDPGANQGPMLGIFITGPIGAVVGAIGGAIQAAVSPAGSGPIKNSATK